MKKNDATARIRTWKPHGGNFYPIVFLQRLMLLIMLHPYIIYNIKSNGVGQHKTSGI